MKPGWHVISCTVTREPSTEAEWDFAWRILEKHVSAQKEENQNEE